MNAQASNLALVFGSEFSCGKVVRVMWPHDVCDPYGFRWVVRIQEDSELVLPDISLMPLNIDPSRDPGGRELLDRNSQAVWDRWATPPDVNF